MCRRPLIAWIPLYDVGKLDLKDIETTNKI